jgi:cytochrome c553
MDTQRARRYGWRTGVRASGLLVLAALAGVAQAADTSATAQLAYWQAQAGGTASAERGGVFFASKHGGDWSCASCHGAPPNKAGKHASTGKLIDPLAPAFNPARLTEVAKVDKWLRRNCKDVLARECSAAEKADVLAYLVGLK